MEGSVAEVRPYGLMLQLEGARALLHRNQMADKGDDRADPQSFSVGDKLEVRQISAQCVPQVRGAALSVCCEQPCVLAMHGRPGTGVSFMTWRWRVSCSPASWWLTDSPHPSCCAQAIR